MNISKGVNYKKLAAETDGFSGADLRALCVEAGMKAIKDNKSQTTYKNFTVNILPEFRSLVNNLLRKFSTRSEDDGIRTVLGGNVIKRWECF